MAMPHRQPQLYERKIQIKSETMTIRKSNFTWMGNPFYPFSMWHCLYETLSSSILKPLKFTYHSKTNTMPLLAIKSIFSQNECKIMFSSIKFIHFVTKKTKNIEASFKVAPFLENTNFKGRIAKKIAKLSTKLMMTTVCKKKKQKALQACFSKDTARYNTMSVVFNTGEQ